MRNSVRVWVLGVIIFATANSASAQHSAGLAKDWFLKDPAQDSVQGISVEKTYATLLKDQPSRSVLVAVIDSGIDIDHEDLKSIIWVNEDEIPNNGIDDDKNGYVDDIHGWNFIGGKDGNVDDDNLEITREYTRLKQKFEGANEAKLAKKQKAEYAQFLKIKDRFEKRKAKDAQQYELFSQQYDLYKNLQTNLAHSIDTLKLITKKDALTLELIEELKTEEPSLLFAKGLVTNVLKKLGPDETIESFLTELNENVSYSKSGVDHYRPILEYAYNENFDSRKVIGDNYGNVNEKNYGNNDVEGPDPSHGTHVAGIIAADRKNELGIKGIADNVRIMSVRTVPNGDERDKDVANAIRYAVDNGAKVINMSFGKSYSPQKEAVDRAVKYAEQKNVLLIHAAGNDGDDIDTEKNYPSRFYLDGKEAKNWMEIGASAWGTDENFVGSFSNYGKKTVDFFAPGVEIYSTTPNNTYQNFDGTSMASPCTTGVAALLMSYFPEFTAIQIKDILRKSTRKFDGLEVQRPGGKGNVKFDQLSNTGGLVNAYEAVKLAQSLKIVKGIK